MSDIVEVMARAFARHYVQTPDYERGGNTVDAEVELVWRDWIPEMQAALTALEEKGYVVVPIEPTEEMLHAARHCWPMGYSDNAKREDAASAWQLMLAASQPSPLAAPAGEEGL